ncbi:PLD nuclease N-terminal domain-containing protein [Nesterenkonia sp. NBAIMH1]|uniref:PLD nuclease N-terminal domain-containing protein n=1 Tax=Nesterenkonia sp. NBAIMH1 TaxID=2600320 RepID=UPI0011B801A0|nr:PLD nuclease N-terminal domain-containing protein [Nesterenkonia sp. NBAIMH1]
MPRLLLGLGVVALALTIFTLIESLQTPRHRVRVMSKFAWIAVIILVPLIGPLLWLFFGRMRKQGPEAQQQRPSSPDDDPEFLRGVEFRRRQTQRREEEDRRRREEERRKKQRDQKKRDAEGDASGGEADAGEADSGTAAPDDEPPAHPNT